MMFRRAVVVGRPVCAPTTLVRPWAPARSLATAAPKKKGKDAGPKGGGSATPDFFEIDEQYPELNLAALTDKDLPEWVHEEVKLTATKAKDRPPPPAGQEDRLFFKIQRRSKIRANNEKKALGL